MASLGGRLADRRSLGQSVWVAAKRFPGQMTDSPQDASERLHDYLTRFTTWALAEPSVRGAILLGSRAVESAADALSDLDLLIIATRPRSILSGNWLDEIGVSPLFSYTYGSPVGGQLVRQAVYEGPLVVDLAVTSVKQSFLTGLAVSAVARAALLRRLIPSVFVTQLDAWVDITNRGTRVLVAKGPVARRMARSIAVSRSASPSEEEFLNTVGAVFGLALWESKQLVRHELWMALGNVDQQIKQHLVKLLQWHAAATSDEPLDTLYSGRGIERWADARWLTMLPAT